VIHAVLTNSWEGIVKSNLQTYLECVQIALIWTWSLNSFISVNVADKSIISRSTEFEGLEGFATRHYFEERLTKMYSSSISQATERQICVRPARTICKGIMSDQMLMADGGFPHSSPQCAFRAQPDYTSRHNSYYKRFIRVSIR
jgi:hypothetical protein